MAEFMGMEIGYVDFYAHEYLTQKVIQIKSNTLFTKFSDECRKLNEFKVNFYVTSLKLW